MAIIKNKNSIVLTIFLLLNFFYIFKQTTLSLSLNINYYYFLIPITFSFIFFLIKFYLKKFNLHRYFPLFSLILLCTCVNFFIFEKYYLFSFVLKLLLLCIILVYLINLKNHKKNFWLLFSKSTLFSVFFITIITTLFFNEQNSLFIVNNLTKKSGGFINPNVGPFFLLSSLLIFFIYKELIYFLLTFLFTIILFYFGIYSRLCLAMSLLFFVIFFLEEKKLYLIYNFFKKISSVLIFLIFVYLLIGITSSIVNWYTHFNGNPELGILHGFRLYEGFNLVGYPLFKTYNYYDNSFIIFPNSNLNYIQLSIVEFFYNIKISISYSQIDYYLSHRGYNLLQGFFIPSANFPFFSINLHDSIYYEVFVRSGFFPLYFLIKSIYSINKVNFKSTFHIRIIIVFFSLLFFGFFEGILFKFSTMAVLIFIFLILDKKALRLF